MGIIIEILVFFGVVGSIVWAGIRDTGKAVSAGVKEKMREREERLQNNMQQPSKPVSATPRINILEELQKEKDKQLNAEMRQLLFDHSPSMRHLLPIMAFPDSFTVDEKEAIIISLFVIAVGSDDPNPVTAAKQEQIIVNAAKLIGYQLNFDKINRLLADESANIIPRLTRLSQDNKEWYAVTLFSVMICEQNLAQEKKVMYNMILGSLGIKPDSIGTLIEKQKNKWFPK